MFSEKSKGLVATIIGVRRAAILALAGALIAASVSACGNRDDTAPLVASAIAITTPSGEITAAGTTQFTATVTDASGATIAVNPTWTVVNGGGTITSDGLFTAGDSAGTFVNTIQATIGSVTSTITVTVSAGALATITVTPATISLSAGATQLFVAIGKDAHGNVVALPNRVWSVAALGGTIDTSGLFTAGTAAGSFAHTVTATSTSIAGSASVTVVAGALATLSITPASASIAIGMTQQYALVGHDANGNIVPVEPVPTWSASAGGTIDANGLFTAGTVAGSYDMAIHASTCAHSTSASLVVTPGPLVTIDISPASASVAPGATQPFTAVGKDAGNNTVLVDPVWTVAAGGGTINGSTGVFTAGPTAGLYSNTVHATEGSIVGMRSVTVVAPVLTTIVVSPDVVSLSPGGQQIFTAAGFDANGNPMAMTPVWSLGHGGGTILSSDGTFTAGTVAGTFANTIQARANGILGTASVTVLAGVPTTITITPSDTTVNASALVQYTAVVTDANGNVKSNTVPVWTVVSGGGTISSPSGSFVSGTTPGSFPNTVHATLGSVVGTASVTVRATTGPLASIVITPANPTIDHNRNNPLTFTATGYDAADNVVPIPNLVWSVNPAVGQISVDGTLNTNGNSEDFFLNAVTATSGSIVAHTSVTTLCGC